MLDSVRLVRHGEPIHTLCVGGSEICHCGRPFGRVTRYTENASDESGQRTDLCPEWRRSDRGGVRVFATTYRRAAAAAINQLDPLENPSFTEGRFRE